MHILVGQDTDSESTPFGAAMPWIVKLDKEQDFIGKWALEHYQEATPTTELVGFTLPNGDVPTEGAVVVDEHGCRPARSRARVTRRCSGARSGWRGCRTRSRTTAPRSRSPTRAGRLEAEIQTKPFYDPDGEVLRS